MNKFLQAVYFAVASALIFNPAALAVTPESVDRKDIPIDEVYKGFQNPAAEARPFVRWWWNNNQVEAQEILRELDILKAAGIGGIEINPIAASEETNPSQAKAIQNFVEKGGKVVYVGQLPERSPGLLNAEVNDKLTAGAVKAALQAGAIRQPAPDKNLPLRNWVQDTLHQCGFRVKPSIRPPSS